MDSESTAQPRFAYPRRFWLRALGLYVLLYVAAVGGVYLLWTPTVTRRLTTCIEAARAANQPVTLADFKPGRLKPEENAAVLLDSLVAVIQHPAGTAHSLRDLSDNVDLALDEPAALRLWVEANERVLARVPELARLRQAEPTADLSNPMNVLLPLASAKADLARLLGIAILDAHARADDRATVQMADAALLGARSIAVAGGTFLEHLVTCAAMRSSCAAIQAVTPTLMIGAARAGDTGVGVGREEVKDLIGKLLADAWLTASVQRAVYFERAEFLGIMDSAPRVGGGPPPGALVIASLAAVMKYDTLYGFRLLTETAEAALQPDYPAVVKALPRFLNRNRFEPAVCTVFSAMAVPALERGLEGTCLTRTTSRMTAIGLALRLYEIDHGRLPARLDELVPDYLANEPADLMADGSAFIYRPEAVPAMLYSVGPNGRDDGGRRSDTRSGSFDGPDDQVYFPHGDGPRRPRPKPLNPDNPNAEGEVP